MSQQPYDAPTAGQARPHYPPPAFPPPAAATGYPSPGAGAYPGAAQHYGPVDRNPVSWGAGQAATPSPMWGLTIPAAILAFPIGLVAVYFSAQVNQRLQVGDLAGATKNAGMAKTWGIVLLVIGAIFTLIAFSSA
jgi:Interferon-induced transmembrane protein